MFLDMLRPKPRLRSSFARISARTWLGFECLEERSVPATFVANTFADVVDPGDAFLSLREAIDRANALPGPDTIKLRAGVYKISLLGDDNSNVAGDFDVTDSLTLLGKGASFTAIESNNALLDRYRLFDVHGDIDMAFTS